MMDSKNLFVTHLTTSGEITLAAFAEILFSGFSTVGNTVVCTAQISRHLSVGDLARYYSFILMGRSEMGADFKLIEEALMSTLSAERDVTETDLASALALVLSWKDKGAGLRKPRVMDVRALKNALLSTHN